VKGGVKREFPSRQTSVTALHDVSLPTPYAAYRLHPGLRYDVALIVPEGVWREPLGATSESSRIRAVLAS
jgi:hypothetical protein